MFDSTLSFLTSKFKFSLFLETFPLEVVGEDVKVSVNENFSTLLDFVFFGFLA